jgi:hypothetical protein
VTTPTTCPTCGLTPTEAHPRQPGVERCANCKELKATPYASLGAEYVGQPGWHLLQLACIPLVEALGVPYLVGSAVLSKNWRDIDVRVILDDERFAELFPADIAPRRLDPWWALVCAGISQYLIRATGMPVDFQIQSRTEAKAYGGPREALGIVPRLPERNEP